MPRFISIYAITTFTALSGLPAIACEMGTTEPFVAAACKPATLAESFATNTDHIAFLQSQRAFETDTVLEATPAICDEDDALCKETLAGQIALQQVEYGLSDAKIVQEYALLCDGKPTYVARYGTSTYPAVSLRSPTSHHTMVQYPTANGGFSGNKGESLDDLGSSTPLFAASEKDVPKTCVEAKAPAALDTISLLAICERVLTQFYDPRLHGLDWPKACETAHQALANGADFEVTATALLAQLETSHTAYYPSDDQTLAILYSVFSQVPFIKDLSPDGPIQLQGAGFFTHEIDGKTFVDQVMDGSPAMKAGILSGDEIIDADGADFRALWPRGAAARTLASVTLRRHIDAEPITVQTGIITGDALALLSDATAKSVRVIAQDGKRIGYLHGWTMMSRQEIGGPLNALQKAWWDGTFADVDAIVLDARGRIGGGGTDIVDFYFSPTETTSAHRNRLSRDWSVPRRKLSTVPLVTIIDHHTRSGTEIMAHILRNKALSTLVGTQTAGAVTGGSLFPLPNKGALYLAVMGLQIDGTELEGIGVRPHVVVQPSQAYSAGADPQRDAAVAEAIKQSEPSYPNPKIDTEIEIE